MESAAKSRFEPTLTDAARRSNVHYHESDQEPSTTTWVLNGVFGSFSRGVLRLYQKRGILERPQKSASRDAPTAAGAFVVTSAAQKGQSQPRFLERQERNLCVDKKMGSLASLPRLRAASRDKET